MGYVRLRRHLEARLGVTLGETTADGRFTLLPIACLGTCDRAPALMIDEQLYRDLDPERLDRVLDRYQGREGDGTAAHSEHQAW
jgi:NADH-quinone oxidoreductase subunit E